MAAGAGAIRAGQAYVELFTKNNRLVTGLRSAQRSLAAFAASVSAIGRGMFAFGVAAAAPFVFAVRQASNATETYNKFVQTFGDEAGNATAFVNELTESIGRSRIETMNGLAAFQAMFRGLSFGQREARAMSEQMQRLVFDFGSFHNITDTEALERLISALAGSSQVLDRFGINIREEALNTQFLRMGIRATAQTATEQQRVMARIAIIQASMDRQGATGDALRTANTFANLWKRGLAVLIDIGAAIGQVLIRPLNVILGWFGRIGKPLQEWIGNNQALVLIIAGLVTGLTMLGLALMVLGPALSAVSFLFGIVTTVISATVAVVGLLASIFFTILTPLGLVLFSLDILRGWLVGNAISGTNTLSIIGRGFREMGESAVTAWRGINAALRAGNWREAAEIAWMGLRVVWNRGILSLSLAWGDFRDFFIDVWEEAVNTVAVLLTRFVAGFRLTMLDAVQAILTLVGPVENFVSGGLVDGLRESIAAIQDEIDQAQMETEFNWQGELERNRNQRAQERQRSAREARAENARLQQELARAAFKAASSPDQATNKNKQALARLLAGGDLESAIRREQTKTDVVGTFSAAAAGGLGFGQSLAQRTATATERTATGIDALRRDVRNGNGAIPVV